MGPESKQTQNIDTDAAITHIRNGLLILAQTGEWSDLTSARSALARLREQSESDGHSDLSVTVAECEASIDTLVKEGPASSRSILEVLDHVSSVEAALLDSSLRSEDFFDDLACLVDAKFDNAAHHGTGKTVTIESTESFAIDEETLEIFRTEASELLASIDKSLRTLVASPSNSQAVWEIRRCAHTFKGAAGIVGYQNGCKIAHKMEDLLDVVVVASGNGAGQPVIDFLTTAVKALHSVLDEQKTGINEVLLDLKFSAAIEWFAGASKQTENETPTSPKNSVVTHRQNETRPAQASPSPVIRVALDRLDHLLEISQKLAAQNSAIAERIRSITENDRLGPDQLSELARLVDTASSINRQLDDGLQRVRMVRFGMIETRLSRVVNNACLDENKKAMLTFENGDIEIDTVVIDALVEPLIHLLKNAVVHGIEPPETRRLIGKPETGKINVHIDADKEALVLTVSDDGGGISISRLKERAVAKGLITSPEAAAIDDHDSLKLIFEQGLTTTDKIDLNAGRGVGMAIVKECIESRGGSVLVESQSQNGTTFRILLPMCPKPSREIPAEVPHAEILDPLILIVDDSSTIRNQAVKIVENAGFRAITANNGAEALELLLSGKWEPDLILSDVEMPQIDGWQLLEYVKTDDNFGGIPVVMITSLDLPKYRKRALALGASDYIVKPVQSSDLERVCRQHASQNSRG